MDSIFFLIMILGLTVVYDYITNNVSCGGLNLKRLKCVECPKIRSELSFKMSSFFPYNNPPLQVNGKFLKFAKIGEFKFILATNRDEFFKRPGKPAHFWEEDGNIFGGMIREICNVPSKSSSFDFFCQNFR